MLLMDINDCSRRHDETCVLHQCLVSLISLLFLYFVEPVQLMHAPLALYARDFLAGHLGLLQRA